MLSNFCISIYCVYVVSLHTESTDSVILVIGKGAFDIGYTPCWCNTSQKDMKSAWILRMSITER